MNTIGNDHGGFARALGATSEQLSIRAGQETDRLRDLSDGDVERVAKRFEGLFLSMLVKEMRKTLPAGFFGEGPGAETFNGWFDDHMGDLLGNNGALDLVGLLKAGQPARAVEVSAVHETAHGPEEGK
jgi:hypothetical protein